MRERYLMFKLPIVAMLSLPSLTWRVNKTQSKFQQVLLYIVQKYCTVYIKRSRHPNNKSSTEGEWDERVDTAQLQNWLKSSVISRMVFPKRVNTQLSVRMDGPLTKPHRATQIKGQMFQRRSRLSINGDGSIQLPYAK